MRCEELSFPSFPSFPNQHAALAAPHTSKNELFRHSHAAVAVGRVAVTGKYHNDDAANASEAGDVVWGMWCG